VFSSISENAGYGSTLGWVAVLVTGVILAIIYLNILAFGKKKNVAFETREVTMVDPNEGKRQVAMVDVGAVKH